VSIDVGYLRYAHTSMMVTVWVQYVVRIAMSGRGTTSLSSGGMMLNKKALYATLAQQQRRRRRAQQLAAQEKAMETAFEIGTVIKNDKGVYRVTGVNPYQDSFYYSADWVSGDKELHWNDLIPAAVERADVGNCTECEAEFYERDDYMCEPCRLEFETELERQERVRAGDVEVMREAEERAWLENMRQEAMASGYAKAVGRA
jgi:hypothetical protein